MISEPAKGCLYSFQRVSLSSQGVYKVMAFVNHCVKDEQKRQTHKTIVISWHLEFENCSPPEPLHKICQDACVHISQCLDLVKLLSAKPELLPQLEFFQIEYKLNDVIILVFLEVVQQPVFAAMVTVALHARFQGSLGRWLLEYRTHSTTALKEEAYEEPGYGAQ